MKTVKILFLIIATMMFVTGCSKTEASTTSISVKSAVCDICVGKIESAVKNIDGVNSASLDLETHMVQVSYDKSRTNVPSIENAIVLAGYGANGQKRNAKAYDKLASCCKTAEAI